MSLLESGLDDFDLFFDDLANRIVDKELEVKVKKDDSIWKERPVDFITFCHDWVGEPLFEGPQEDFARDVIGEPDAYNFWSTYKRVIYFAWGKGSGKSSLSAKLLTYTAYLLLSMKDPREYFGLGKTAPIHLLNISYNSDQAKTVFFLGYLVPTVKKTINPHTGNNFFSEKGMIIKETGGDILADAIHFERPRREGEGGIIAKSMAGDKGTSEGFSPLLIFVDEISAMQNPKKAEDLIDALEDSAVSRFQDNYKLIMVSFKKGRNCLMSLKVSEALEKKLPHVYVSLKPTWEVNRLKSKEQFKGMYDKNPVKASRTFEFKEVEGVDESVFLKIFDRVLNCFVGSNFNPFWGDVIKCRTDQLKILKFKSWFKAENRTQYHVHIDLAKGTAKDRAGLVMIHKEGLEALSEKDLQKFIDGETDAVDMKIKADIILQLLPDKNLGQIIFEDIRKFIFTLVDLGFKIDVTLDGYQSVDFMQQLIAKGIQADLLSVDRDKKCYESLQSLFYRNSIEVYEHPVLIRELKELEESEDGKKVDHPVYSVERAKSEDGIKAGSKDLSDALCGACFKAILAPAASIPIAPIMQDSISNDDDEVLDQVNFEQAVFGGSVQVDKKGKPTNPLHNFILPMRG